MKIKINLIRFGVAALLVVGTSSFSFARNANYGPFPPPPLEDGLHVNYGPFPPPPLEDGLHVNYGPFPPPPLEDGLRLK